MTDVLGEARRHGAPRLGAAGVEELLALARPAVLLHPDGAADDPGDPWSRLGGDPLLEDGDTWPEHRGEPLHFVAQLRLDEVDRSGADLALPRTGLLAFFYLPGEELWGYDPADAGAWAVRAVEPSAARPRAAPHGAVRYHPRRLVPAPTATVPDRFADALGPLRARHGDDAVDAVLSRLDADRPRTRHQALGWPSEGHDPMVRALHQVGRGEYAGGGPRRGSTDRPDGWRLLLQVDGDDDAGMVWGDACRLCFWVRDEHLRAGRWDEAWMLLRCG